MAGHLTQPSKLVLLAIGKTAKHWAKSKHFGDHRPKVLDNATLVGDTITTVKSDNLEQFKKYNPLTLAIFENAISIRLISSGHVVCRGQLMVN